MVVVRCDTLFCATHRVAAAPVALATGTGRPVALRDMMGTPHQELGGSRARLGGVQAGLDRGSSSPTLMWVIGSRLYGEAITMDAGECNKAVLIRLGITLTGFIAPVVVLICLGITLTGFIALVKINQNPCPWK